MQKLSFTKRHSAQTFKFTHPTRFTREVVPFQLNNKQHVTSTGGDTGLELLTSIDLSTSYKLAWYWSRINSAQSIVALISSSTP